MRRAVVEQLITLKPDTLSYLPLHHFERPGAVGPGGPVGARFYVFLIYDKGRRVGQLGQKVRFSGVDGYLQGIVTQHSDAAHAVCRPVQHGLGPDDVVQVQIGHRGLGSRVQGPFHTVFEVLRGDGLAVVKFDVLSQVEGVSPTVVGYVPPFGYIGDYVQVCVNAHQSAVDLYYQGRRGGIAGEGRVQGRWVAKEPRELPAGKRVTTGGCG